MQMATQVIITKQWLLIMIHNVLGTILGGNLLEGHLQCGKQEKQTCKENAGKIVVLKTYKNLIFDRIVLRIHQFCNILGFSYWICSRCEFLRVEVRIVSCKTCEQYSGVDTTCLNVPMCMWLLFVQIIHIVMWTQIFVICITILAAWQKWHGKRPLGFHFFDSSAWLISYGNCMIYPRLVFLVEKYILKRQKYFL